MHSDCANCTVNVPKKLHMQTGAVWMEAWQEHAACQLQAIELFYFAVKAEYQFQGQRRPPCIF